MPDLIPPAPGTSDPLTWIAMSVVGALIVLLAWQLKAAQDDRHAYMLALEKQREHDSKRTSDIHERLDDIRTAIADGKGCRAAARS